LIPEGGGRDLKFLVYLCLETKYTRGEIREREIFREKAEEEGSEDLERERGSEFLPSIRVLQTLL